MSGANIGEKIEGWYCYGMSDAERLTDKQQHDLLVGEAIERAAKDLPDGYYLNISIEQGAGWVEWTNNEGNTMGLDGGGEPFHAQINSALDAAIRAGKKG